jgi:hypothetical protein
MPVQTPPTRRHALLACAGLFVTVALCAGLLSLAVLMPAPPAALPLLLVACLGGPALAAHELPYVLEVLRARRRAALPDPRPEAEVLEELRRALDALPETHHPLDL